MSQNPIQIFLFPFPSDPRHQPHIVLSLSEPSHLIPVLPRKAKGEAKQNLQDHAENTYADDASIYRA